MNRPTEYYLNLLTAVFLFAFSGLLCSFFNPVSLVWGAVLLGLSLIFYIRSRNVLSGRSPLDVLDAPRCVHCTGTLSEKEADRNFCDGCGKSAGLADVI